MLKNSKKICSIIYHGRNDDYNPHFLNRLNYVLEFEASNIYALGLSEYIDLVVIDWGSDKTFREELILTSENSKIIKFFEVSKEIAMKEGDPDRNYYHVTKVQNVGLRSVNTEYVIINSHDLILGRVSLFNLYNLLTCKTIDLKQLQNSFFHIPKFILPEDLFHKTPSFQYLSRWLERSSFLEGDIGVRSGAAQAAELASLKIWHKLTGVDEKLSKYGYIDSDLHSRASMIASCLDSFKFGICMYKLPRGIALTRKYSKKNPSLTSFIPNVNRENWGLNNYNIPFFSSNNIKKDFDEKNLVLITKEKKNHKTIHNLLSIFLVPVSLRLFYISFLEVALFKYIHLLVSPGNVRTLVFFGYRNAYGPLLIAKLKRSLDLFIISLSLVKFV